MSRHDHHSKKLFPRPVFVIQLLLNPSYQSTHLTVPRGLCSVVPSFRSVIPFRHSVPSFRSVIPSLPHFTIPSLRFCLHGIMMERLYHSYKESFPQTSKVSKVSKESFHQKIVSGNKPFWQRIIPSKFPNINITNSIPSKNSIWE